MKLSIGDRVTTKNPVEALYSGDSNLYPVQFFLPGMEGTIIAVDSPSVRRNVSQYVVKFEGSVYGTIAHPYTDWTVRIDPKDISSI